MGSLRRGNIISKILGRRNAGDKLSGFAPKKTFLLLIIIILLVSFAAYFNSLFNGFVYDDRMQIRENHWIRDIRFIPDIFISSAWSFQSETTVSNYYRPMMHMIYMLNYFIFGLKPWGFHLVNIFFHAGVSVLVFIIARKLLSRCEPSDRATMEGLLPLRSQSSDSALLPAFLASLLFATHPIHTEAVTWIAGVPDLSYTFFCLLSFYLYMRSKDELKGMYWLSLLSFAGATLCKEPALTLPFILIAYDIAFRRSSPAAPHPPSLIKRYSPYFVLTGIYLTIRFYALGGFSPQKPHIILSAYGYIINVFPLFAEYLEKLLLPLNLNAFHVLHPISSIFELRGIISLAITAVFVVFGYLAFKKNKLVFFSLLLIILPLLPSLYIPAVGENVFTERYLYLPSFGFVLLVVLPLLWARSVQPRLFFGMALISVALSIAYSIGTVNRNTIWRDDFSLYTDMVRKSPDAAQPHDDLGNIYKERGYLDEAINEYKAALILKPEFYEAHYNLGNTYEKEGHLDEAINEYKIAITLEPAFIQARNNLGLAYADRGFINEAVDEFMKAIKLKPDDFVSHNNLGMAYALQNRYNEAIGEFVTSLKLNPDNAVARENLETCYEKMKKMNR
jgi:tetratricopeptide (TPR) repeat protein